MYLVLCKLGGYMSEDIFWTLERHRRDAEIKPQITPSEKEKEERVVIKIEDGDKGNEPDISDSKGHNQDSTESK